MQLNGTITETVDWTANSAAASLFLVGEDERRGGATLAYIVVVVASSSQGFTKYGWKEIREGPRWSNFVNPAMFPPVPSGPVAYKPPGRLAVATINQLTATSIKKHSKFY